MTPPGHVMPTRLRLVASGVFFCGYLLFHTVYPTLAWFLPGYDKFTWQMFSGRDGDPLFAVVFADGSRREVGYPLKVGSAVRVLGASVDQSRVVPPWLCANWHGAEAVLAVDRVTGHEEVLPCRSAAR